MELVFDIKLTEGQKMGYDLCHNPNNKKVVLCYSRQSGKTVLAEILLIEYLCKRNKYSVYISPTFQLGRKVYRELLSLLEGTNIIKKANSSTLTIESVFGSTLQFHSAEAYTSIRGTTVSGVLIIDEAAYIPDIMPNGESFWSNICMPITKARKPLTVFISTPCGKQGFFYEYYLKALNNEDGIVQLTRTIYDDNLVTEEQIKEIKESISSKAFEQEFLCKFLDSALTFFEGFENNFTKYTYQKGKEWIGIDLSGNGTDETIFTSINTLNQVRQVKVTGTLDIKIAKLASLINESNAVMVYMENNGLGAPIINDVKKLVHNSGKIVEWTTTNASKEDIISNLAVAIANKTIMFNQEDTELFAQFGTFICKISKTKKLTFAAQEGKKDDRIMSLAIALKCKDDNKYTGNLNINFARGGTKKIY